MPYNVLVVDDSAVMRAMLVRVLRMSGLPLGTVYEAGDGARALDLLAAHDVVKGYRTAAGDLPSSNHGARWNRY